MQTALVIPAGDVQLRGDLLLPEHPKAIIIFCHGSGSSRLSSRNRMVASFLNEKGFGSLLFDLLSEEEDLAYANRFDIHLLSKRLVAVTKWVQQQSWSDHYPVGYFGASTGAAAALKAAAELGDEIYAVVSRGGRPDLAGNELALVKAATLLLIGSLDSEVIRCNKNAFAQLNCKKEFCIIPGASHLFEEEGKLQEVCKYAAAWFFSHVPALPFTVK